MHRPGGGAGGGGVGGGMGGGMGGGTGGGLNGGTGGGGEEGGGRGVTPPKQSQKPPPCAPLSAEKMIDVPAVFARAARGDACEMSESGPRELLWLVR